MKHEVKARYPASPDVIIKMFADKGFHVRKLDALGLPYKVLSQAGDARQFKIRVERKVPVQMPGIGKKAEATVVNEEIWNLAGKNGVVKVEPGAMPIQCSCTVALQADGNDTVVTYSWEIKATIPLIGGKIEKMAVTDMDARFEEETRAALQLLKDYV